LDLRIQAKGMKNNLVVIEKSQVTDGVFFKVSTAARYLGISPNTLRSYTDKGLIKAKRLPNGDRIYRRGWLDEFIERLPDAVEAP
jgi:hypothetical protein